METAVNQLPETTLTCRNGHSFTTRARGGTSVSCPACRPARVAVWVPKDRAPAALEADAGGELAARWAGEPAWRLDRLGPLPGRPGDMCPECDGPLFWEPGRTRTFCPECRCVELPAAVTGHYERQAQRRAEVAVRTEPDQAAQRAARARLRASQDLAKRRVGEWLDTIADEESYDRAQWQRQAAELAAMLRGYLPEIAAAGSEQTLAEVWREISALVSGDQGRALAAEYEQAQERAERQYRAQLAAEEYEREQRAAAELAARQERAAELEQTRERKAIASAPPRPGGYVDAAAIAIGMIERSRQQKARQIAEKGKCAFKHRSDTVATRLYGVPWRDWQGQMNGRALTDTPQYRVCAKHYKAAEAQLNRDGYTDLCFWEL